VNLLDDIGPTKKISLILHSNGGQTLAAWRLVNLIQTFCDELEVLIPLKALSAGTLISIGADKLVMTKQAALGPIDPSVNNPLNPEITINGQRKRVPVSVENVRGYLDAATTELGIKDSESRAHILTNLASHIHPLVLGEIFRSRAQIRFLASKLIKRQIGDAKKVKKIIDFLCADSGSHDYTINRREAVDLGLNVEKPSPAFYALLRKIQESYTTELKLLEPYDPQVVIAGAGQGIPVTYTEVRALIESSSGGSYGFVSTGTLTSVTVGNPPQPGIQDTRAFDRWKKLH